MKLRRWEAWAIWKLPSKPEPEEICTGRHFTRWGANFALDWKLGSAPVSMLWAHGDIEWVRGEVRPAR